MSNTKFSVNDVKEVISDSDLELLHTKKLLVEISIIRPSDNSTSNGLSSKFAVGMHFSASDEMDESDDSYGYPAYTDRLFTLDEITEMMKAFGIQLDEKVWQITQDPSGENGSPQILNDLNQVREVPEDSGNV